MRNPYQYQVPAIELGKSANLLLNDECGLGKKFVCIQIAHHMLTTTQQPNLVVTVKRDAYQWKKEIIADFPTSTVVIGGVDPIMLPGDNNWWLILHYEALVRHSRPLTRIKWATIILDEGHYIKNWQAQRSRAAKRLKAHRKVVATGTPLDKTPEDLWSPLDFLYPATYHGTLRAFREKYVKTKVTRDGLEYSIIGCKQPQTLARELAPFMLARTKDEVAPDLPPNIQKTVHIELTGQQAAIYRRIKRSVDIEVIGPELDNPMFIPSRLAQLIRLQQVALDPTMLNLTSDAAKLEWLYDWRHDNPDEPLIVFTTFRDTAQKVSRALDAHLIMGGVKLPTHWTKPTIVGTIGAASEALDLGWVRTGIFLDVSWKSSKMTQAISRIHRINNTAPCQTIFLIAHNTVDEVMLEAVEKKWDAYSVIREYVARFNELKP